MDGKCLEWVIVDRNGTNVDVCVELGMVSFIGGEIQLDGEIVTRRSVKKACKEA